MDHYDCIKPLLRVQQCLGIGAFYVKKQNNFKPHEYYTKKFDFLITLFVMVLITSALIVKRYFYSDSSLGNDCFLLTLMNMTDVYEIYFGLFLFYIAYIMTYKHRFIIMEAHTMIEEVDKTLQDFQYDIPYRKIRNFSTIAVLILILLEILVIIIVSYDTIVNDFTEILFVLLECLVNIIYTIVIGVFINLMFCLRYRFRAINDLFVRNFKQNVTINKHSAESERILNEQEIDTLTKTHEKLCDVSDSISDAFSMILFCVSSYLFVLIIIDVFIAMKMFILGFNHDQSVFVQVALILTYVVVIYSIKLGLLVLSTELVISETSRTHAFVHKSINCYDQDSIRNKLTIFLMQLINRKPTFTACGLFEINLPLLFSMVGALFTYVIILIQFDQSDKGCIGIEPIDDSTNSSLEMISNDTITNLMTGLESKIYLNITEVLDNFSTNMTYNLMKLIETGKQHLPILETNLSIPNFETNLSFANDSIKSSDLSSKMMNIIKNMNNMNDLLKNISSDIQDLLLNN